MPGGTSDIFSRAIQNKQTKNNYHQGPLPPTEGRNEEREKNLNDESATDVLSQGKPIF